MDDIPNHSPAPLHWVEALIEGKAQIEAGQTVPLEPVLARLEASATRMEVRRSAQGKRAARRE